MNGPFSVMSSTGLAIGVKAGSCGHDMMLETQDDDYSSSGQQFYVGKHGGIMSAKCHGLVITSLQEACTELLELHLKLRTYQIDKKGVVDNCMT